MKIVSSSQALQRKNSDQCVVTEYPLMDDRIDFAVVEISGRYPEQGRVINKKCTEIVYIHQGQGKVTVDHKEYTLNAKDVVLIEPEEKFFWEGNMTLFISCTPAFTIDQHEAVD